MGTNLQMLFTHFRNIHGINPSQARLGGASLSSYKRVFFPTDNTTGENMNYKMIEARNST